MVSNPMRRSDSASASTMGSATSTHTRPGSWELFHNTLGATTASRRPIRRSTMLVTTSQIDGGMRSLPALPSAITESPVRTMVGAMLVGKVPPGLR